MIPLWRAEWCPPSSRPRPQTDAERRTYDLAVELLRDVERVLPAVVPSWLERLAAAVQDVDALVRRLVAAWCTPIDVRLVQRDLLLTASDDFPIPLALLRPDLLRRVLYGMNALWVKITIDKTTRLLTARRFVLNARLDHVRALTSIFRETFRVALSSAPLERRGVALLVLRGAMSSEAQRLAAEPVDADDKTLTAPVRAALRSVLVQWA